MSKDLFFKMRQEELAHLIQEVEEGNRDALTAYANIKKLESEVKNARTQIEELAMNEAENYSGKTFEYNGFKFEKRNGATRYSYKNIAKWKEANKNLKDIESEAKQAFIAKQKGMMVASEDGEEIELPEVNYSKDSLVVK